jgi:hemerythrin superfamily protein
MPRQKAVSTEASTEDKTSSKSTKTDAVSLLKADHRNVEALFEKFEKTEDSDEKEKIAKKICNELITHSQLEEEIFYPACREQGVESDSLDEAQVEHDGAKVMINELLTCEPDDEFYDAKVTVLKEYIRHHVGEEEKARGGIFAQARKAGLDMDALGQRLQARKEEIKVKAENDTLSPPSYRSLNLQQPQQQRSLKETRMARQGNYDDDDDDRSYSGRYTGNYGRQGSQQGQQRQQGQQGGQQRQQGSRQGSSGGYGSSGSDYDQGRRYAGSTGNQQSQWNQEQGYNRDRSGGYGSSGWEGRGSSRDQGYESGYGSSGRGSSYGQDYDQNRQFGGGGERNRASRRDWEDSGSYGRGNFDDDYGTSSRRGSTYGAGSSGGYEESPYGSSSSERGTSSRSSGSGSRSTYDEDNQRGSSQSSRSARRNQSDDESDYTRRSGRSWED